MNEYLTLLVFKDGRVGTLLPSTLMASSSTTGGVDDEGNPWRDEVGNETPAVIRVMTTQTAGHFHLQKRLGRKAAMFHWNGNIYVTTDPDPVKNVFEP